MNESALRSLLAEMHIDVSHKFDGWLMCSCPFAPYLHEKGTDSKPSFGVKIEPMGFSGYSCFTCGKRGNLHSMITELGRMREENYNGIATRVIGDEIPDKQEDYDSIASRLWEEAEDAEPIDSELYMRMYPLAWEIKEAKGYLISRNITKSASELLQLRYDPDTRRVMFPALDLDNNLYGFSGRSILSVSELGKYPKVKDYGGLPKKQLLLGEHLVRDREDKPLIVVEGLFALASLVSRGVLDYAVPVATMKAAMSEAQAEILRSFDRPVYMLYDNDKAGLIGTYGEEQSKDARVMGGAVGHLRNHVPVTVMRYPKGVNDPDYLTREHLTSMLQDKGAVIF